MLSSNRRRFSRASEELGASPATYRRSTNPIGSSDGCVYVVSGMSTGTVAVGGSPEGPRRAEIFVGVTQPPHFLRVARAPGAASLISAGEGLELAPPQCALTHQGFDARIELGLLMFELPATIRT